MTIARRFTSIDLKLFFVALSCALLFGSCGYFDAPNAPAYKSVATVTDGGAIGEPFGIATNGDVVFVSDGETGTIWKLNPAAAPTSFATGLNTPSAIAFLPNGDLAVADTGSHTIRRISSSGEVAIIAGVENVSGSADGTARSATFNAPVGLAVAKDGSIYVADTYNDRIRIIRDDHVSTVAGSKRGFADGDGTAAMLDTPLGIAVWGENLLIADSGNARVRLIDLNRHVSTLAGSGHQDLIDGPLSNVAFVAPTAIATDSFGQIFVADGNAIRVIGRRAFPFVETLAGDRRGLLDGNARRARFSRPSGLTVTSDGTLYVCDSDNRVVRQLSDSAATSAEQPAATVDTLPLATRWPYEPQSAVREIAGTLGEIRGDIGPENKPVWFHNGLDIAGAYGETARFLRDETVLDPQSADNFGTARELLRLPLLGYIHLRLGRDKDNNVLDAKRFQFERDDAGRLSGVRVPRGARFAAGDVLGTLNAMNHVHLIAGRPGHEINAFAALSLPGVADTIAPVIEDIKLFTADWREITDGKPTERTRVVVRAYDRVDGNAERRRLGVYRVGYQLFSNGTALGEMQWTIRFDRAPSNDAVQTAYAYGSRSGYTPDTVFNYIATNRVDGDSFREEFLDVSSLAAGRYTLRVFVSDYFENVTTRDVEVTKE